MIELEIRLTTDDTRPGFSLGDHSKEGEINTSKKFEDEDVESILTFMIKVLDFNGFDLRSKVLEVDHLGKVVSIEHRGRK
jgi:hypothetical protein|tara:strand:+ start:1276 stop:1515 length:240 start_codon:yes stop_codon:yes gene_type:complete